MQVIRRDSRGRFETTEKVKTTQGFAGPRCNEDI